MFFFNDVIPNGYEIFRNNPIFVKNKNYKDYLEDIIINSNNLSLEEQIKKVTETFFELCFKLYDSTQSSLLNLLTKVFNKLRNLYYLNIIILYYKIFNSVIYEIHSNYNKEIKFNVKDDIILTPIFNSNTIKLKFTSTTKKKLYYLKSLVEKIIYTQYDYEYIQYIFYDSNFPYGHVIEIILLNDRLFLKENQEKINLNGFSNAIYDKEKPFKGDKIKKTLLKCEYYIMENFRLTNRNRVKFINSFNEFKNLLLSDQFFLENIYEIRPYGSFIQLSFNNISDLEITIITKDYSNFNSLQSEDFISKIKDLLTLKEPNKYENINIRKTKRTFLLNFYDKINQVTIELVLNNVFGILNSILIRNYMTFDSRAIILINIIKNWSKEKGINGNYKGHLSSYCYTLMVIYFLQRLKNPILPIINSKNNLEKVFIQNKEYFIEKSLLNSFENINFNSKNKDSISVLMMKFLWFYLYEFDENKYCIDITNEKVIFRFNEMRYLNYFETKNKRSAYIFIDIFDYSYNPGAYLDEDSTPHKNLKKVMKRTLLQMLNGNENMLKNDKDKFD